MEWLTVKMVEGLHEAIRLGLPVSGHVANLRHATIAGLLEYGCLRYSITDGSLPTLPNTILSGRLGQALNEIRSPLGFRSNGSQKPHVKSVEIREVEFHALEGSAPTLDPAWEDFANRFFRSAVDAGFQKVVADGIGATMHELAENVFLHAESPVGAVAGYHVSPGVACFTIADVGVGVLASLRTCSEYTHLQYHGEALSAVLRNHASKFGSGKGGNGFRQLFKSLVDQRGELRFRTGEARMTMSGELSSALGVGSFGESLPGFQITVVCRTANAITDHPLL
ncbi:hypothetical protein BH11PLA2_BH11PLA2_16500 [soil metagenome]